MFKFAVKNLNNQITNKFTTVAKSSKPILYYDDISPPCRSVLLLQKAMEIDLNMEYVDLFKQENLSSKFKKLNPLHKVPVLKHNNLILTDSHVILEYLVEIYSNGSTKLLYPDNKIEQIKIKNRLYFNNSIFFKYDSELMNDIFVNQATDLDEHLNKVKECYDYLELFLAENKFMAIGNMSIADFAILTTLSTTNLIAPVTYDKWPKLNEWFNELKKLPYYGEANQMGIDNLKSKLNTYSKIKIL